MPDANTLCHYTTAEAAFAHIIPSERLRLSPYSKMSDPLENRELAFGGGVWRDDEDAEEKYARVVEMITRQRDLTRLLSFTVDATEGYDPGDVPFQYAWTRARLWQQYAENHAGVCLVFDFEKVTPRLYDRLSRLGAAGQGRVVYTSRGFRDTPASTLLLDEFELATLASDVAQFVVDHTRELFFVKALDWASEHEFRFTLMPNVDPDAVLPEYSFVDYGSSLREVVLGEHFPQWQIPAARAMCDRRGIQVSQIQWRMGRPWPMPTRPVG